MTSQLVAVSPDLAAQWLGGNTVNRNLRARVVDMYARDMAAGNWRVTGESIKLSKSGRLLDGQHRLSAVIKSGVTIQMYVVFDLEDAAQEVMDSGIQRNAADALTMSGVKNAATYTAVARLAIAFERGDKMIGKGGITNSEVYEWLERHPAVSEAVSIAVRYQKRVFCPPSIIAFSSYLIWQTVGDWYDIDEFWCAAAEKVGLKHGDPVIALANRFVQDRARRAVIPRRAQLSAIVRAWNFRRAGKPLMRILYESPHHDGIVAVPEVAA